MDHAITERNEMIRELEARLEAHGVEVEPYNLEMDDIHEAMNKDL